MDTALRKRRFLCAALIPTMLVYSLFVIVPIIWSIYYGFFNWKGIGDATFIGMANYIEVLQDSIFWLSLKNNLIIVGASVFFQVPIALVLALLLTRTTWFQKFVRTSVFMPMVLSSVVIGMIWGYVYNPQMGILNALLDFLGLESLKMQWLSDPDIAMYFVAIPIIWNFIGLYLVIFIASLQNISSELDDALQLDGANFFQALFYIKLPLIWNTIKVAIVLCISGSLKTFDLVIVMTGGGPANATEIMASYMYNSTFEVYRFGYGSALSAMILIISLLFIVISQLLMKRKTA